MHRWLSLWHLRPCWALPSFSLAFASLESPLDSEGEGPRELSQQPPIYKGLQGTLQILLREAQEALSLWWSGKTDTRDQRTFLNQPFSAMKIYWNAPGSSWPDIVHYLKLHPHLSEWLADTSCGLTSRRDAVLRQLKHAPIEVDSVPANVQIQQHDEELLWP